jgi:hypothetical protein
MKTDTNILVGMLYGIMGDVFQSIPLTVEQFIELLEIPEEPTRRD